MAQSDERVATGGALVGADAARAPRPASFLRRQRQVRSPGLVGLMWLAIWTLFLIAPLQAGWRARDTTDGWLGILGTASFGAWYLVVVVARRRRLQRGDPPAPIATSIAAVTVAVALAVVVSMGVGQIGTTCAVYISILAVVTTPRWPGLAIAAVNALGWWAAGYLVRGWEPDASLLFGMVAAAAAVYGVRQMTESNRRLRAAQQENARLAVSEERNRFARDLHDILGHSLTVITVKAELAHRLLPLDPERAERELADLEQLSRDALADVRRAVEGYRELTLPGEIARARAALAAAEIHADLPGRTDDVPGDLRELFAWTIREGVTNVIRHSGATRCTVRLTPTSAEVRDDGAGRHATNPAGARGGHGLDGLRERAAAAGASVTTDAVEPHGFLLRVAL